MADPLILYSVNTWLAYRINERYYAGLHYAWRAPVFDYESRYAREIALSATSNPVTIYRGLRDETATGDRHSAKVKDNKLGIIRGATLNRAEGLINASQEREIIYIVDKAETTDFRPLLYLIPFSSVASIVSEVPVDKRAHPLAQEYLIERLPRDRFDVIEFPS